MLNNFIFRFASDTFRLIHQKIKKGGKLFVLDDVGVVTGAPAVASLVKSSVLGSRPAEGKAKRGHLREHIKTLLFWGGGAIF